MKNIIVPVDFSENSKILILKGSELAAVFGAKLWLLHIASPIPDGMTISEEEQALKIQKNNVVIQKAAVELKEKGYDAEALLIQEPTVGTFLNELEKRKVDLIVLGFHSGSFVNQPWFAEQPGDIIKKSGIPLFVVPISEA